MSVNKEELKRQFEALEELYNKQAEEILALRHQAVSDSYVIRQLQDTANRMSSTHAPKPLMFGPGDNVPCTAAIEVEWQKKVAELISYFTRKAKENTKRSEEKETDSQKAYDIYFQQQHERSSYYFSGKSDSYTKAAAKVKEILGETYGGQGFKEVIIDELPKTATGANSSFWSGYLNYSNSNWHQWSWQFADSHNKAAETLYREWVVERTFNNGKTWSRSGNKGLEGTFSSEKAAVKAQFKFGSTGVRYRVRRIY
jgi:hypothetical protein